MADAGYSEKWIVYSTPHYSAKELTVFPGRSVIIRDAAAYGLIVTQGYGSIGKQEVETPSLIRYGQMTKDELFVTADAAANGVRLTNRSATENLVMLKHFGPGNPQAPLGPRAMRRIVLFAAALLRPHRSRVQATVLAASAVGVHPPSSKKAEGAARLLPCRPATAGTITGDVTFAGVKPARQAISMDADEGCQKAHAGKPVYDEAVLIGKNGGLANAFVYIQSGLEGKKFEPAREAVVLDQHGCMFVPRVIGLRAGQTLDLKNGDAVSHNVHPMPANNREWNQEQSPQAPAVEHRFVRPEVMIPVKCNIHAWMHCYIGVVDHPYFAVTGPDGAFEWKNVPPGDYTVAVWHEKLGEQKQQVHVAPSGSEAVNFTYR